MEISSTFLKDFALNSLSSFLNSENMNNASIQMRVRKFRDLLEDLEICSQKVTENTGQMDKYCLSKKTAYISNSFGLLLNEPCLFKIQK